MHPILWSPLPLDSSSAFFEALWVLIFFGLLTYVWSFQQPKSDDLMKRSKKLHKVSPSSHPPVSANLVVGRNAVREVLRHSPTRILKLFAAEGAEKELGELMRGHLQVNRVEKKTLTDLCGTDSHQGIAVELKDRPHFDLDDLIDSAPDDEVEHVASYDNFLVLALDDVQDPHNLGAIFRASECFGINWLLWSKNRGASITPTVTKVSAGATELVRFVSVSNLHDAILKLKKNGFWIIATCIGEESVSLLDFEWPKRAVLILGNEGEGVKKLLLKEADFKVAIPQFGQIDSLNVSQATSVLLFDWRAKSIQK